MRRYLPAKRVAVIEAHDAIFVARLPDGPLMRLSATAAVIWTAAIEHGETFVGDVSAVVGMPEADIADDIHAFVADLIERGLLVSDDGVSDS